MPPGAYHPFNQLSMPGLPCKELMHFWLPVQRHPPESLHLTSLASISTTGPAGSFTFCFSVSPIAEETLRPRKNLLEDQGTGFFSPLIRDGQACRQHALVLSQASQVCSVNGKIVISPVASEIIPPNLCTKNKAEVEKKSHTAVFRRCSFYSCSIAVTPQSFQRSASFSGRHGCLPAVSTSQTSLA